MADDMHTPMVLGMIGGVLILLISLIIGIVVASLGASLGPLGTGFLGMGIVLGVWGLIVGIVILVGANMMKKPDSAKTGSILVLIFGILGFFTPGAGIIVGPILAIIGGALGIGKAK